MSNASLTIRDAVLPIRDSEAIPAPAAVLGIGFRALLAFHGGANPGGVAHGVAAMHAALPRLAAALGTDLVDRRAVRVRTSFGGPGARDAFEGALRAVSGERYEVDGSLAEPARGRVLQRYVFRFAAGSSAVTVRLRDEGFVVPEFLDLGGLPDPTPAQLARIAVLKVEMTERIVARAPGEVYEPIGEEG